jgi:hypothetical protein
MAWPNTLIDLLSRGVLGRRPIALFPIRWAIDPAMFATLPTPSKMSAPLLMTSKFFRPKSCMVNEDETMTHRNI